MNFDEANARITTELAGRTVDWVERNGKEIDIVCTCGHVITLQADVKGDIHYKKTGVRIVLRNLPISPQLGNIR